MLRSITRIGALSAVVATSSCLPQYRAADEIAETWCDHLSDCDELAGEGFPNRATCIDLVEDFYDDLVDVDDCSEYRGSEGKDCVEAIEALSCGEAPPAKCLDLCD